MVLSLVIPVEKLGTMPEDVHPAASHPSRETSCPPTRGPAGEGSQETHTNIINCIPIADDCTDNDEIVLRAVDPAHVYHVAGYINGVAINFMVDTWASVSLLHADIWKEVTT